MNPAVGREESSAGFSSIVSNTLTSESGQDGIRVKSIVPKTAGCVTG